MSQRFPFVRLLALALAAGLAACSSINKTLEGDKVDYRTGGSKTVSLEVPPDLSQLQRDSRYQPASGTISASTLQAPAAPASAPVVATVALATRGEAHIERSGSQRWLSSPQSAEQLWPQLKAFWQERGFELDLEQRDTGLMETNWLENRAKLPQDFVRRTLGRVLDSLYETGERDRFRTRLERAPDGGTEIYISHRGMAEVYTDDRKDTTRWQPRPADPGLEAVMLSRLMQKLGGEEERVRTADAAASASVLAAANTSRARLIDGAPGSGLQVDDGFDRAWRRVGLALDRSGFTVEDRDRAQGLYFVRYVDPKSTARAEPGFFGKLFGGGKNEPAGGALARYRIAVKGQADSTLVTVQNNQGAPETGDAAQRILELLVTDLR